ncbi:MAG: YicC family protein [Verrucomicrobia bacterium]|nr:YicC family protein [Verrucomicrobiota bacterium]
MRSMTGFGSSRVSTSHAGFRVEASSVNKRGLEVIVFLPGDLARLEREIREEVASQLTRGKVTVAVQAEVASSRNGRSLDLKKAALYASQLRAAGKKLGVQGGPSWSDLLGLPGVVSTQSHPLTPKDDRKILAGVRSALAKMVFSREREGGHMVRALKGHLSRMEIVRAKMEKAAGAMRKNQGDRLRVRLQELAREAGVELDAERLFKEVSSAADRGDITEEISRIRAHLSEASGLTGKRAPGGRTLEFLIQELMREANTVGSKSGEMELTRLAIEFKSELEKLREQAANLE